MIEMNRGPIARDVAILASVAARDMGRGLAHRRAASRMAGSACSERLSVIETLNDVETRRLMTGGA